MKKISILTTLMLFVLTVQAQEVIKGDANNDKAINLLDVLETSNAILGNPSENYNAKNADVNGDDQVNIADIVGITNIIINNEQTAPTKADLIGTWEIPDEQDVSITFTESQITMTHRGTVQYEVPYTFENGILTYTTPPPFEGMEPYTETYSVSVLYDKSVLALKFTTVDEEEVVHLYINKAKKPDTSKTKLDGKWFCYHNGNKSTVRQGLWIDGDKAEFIIGAWSTRMVGTYTYSNGILTLKPTAYYSGRGGDEWGYGRIDPATLECPEWEQIDNPGYPETFAFILNGNEAYSWYANTPCLYHKQ